MRIPCGQKTIMNLGPGIEQAAPVCRSASGNALFVPVIALIGPNSGCSRQQVN
jgi:hypothetical protein